MSTVDHPNQAINSKKGYKTTLTTYDNIQSSPGFQKYSFSVGKRDPIVNKSPCKQSGYTLPTTKTERCAGFGIGERFNHNRNPNSSRDTSPDPTAYNLPTQFKS